MNAEVEFTTGQIRPLECFKEAWELLKPNYWILFAISLVGIMIGGATLYILLGAMVCGIMYCYLKALEGVEPKFEDLFRGFRYWKAGLLITALVVLPTFAVIGVVYTPILLATFSGARMSQDELMAMLAGTFAVELVLSVVMVCLHTLLMFAFPLVVDKNLSGWQAIKLSARAVLKNLTGVAGIMVLGFCIALAGWLVFCIGLYFAIPIVLAGNLVAFRKVFPVRSAAQ